jgi:hypothetical protein
MVYPPDDESHKERWGSGAAKLAPLCGSFLLSIPSPPPRRKKKFTRKPE